MLNKINHALTISCSINRSQLIVVGVSGGADSLALAHGLNSKGYLILITHFNHQLRPEAEKELQKVMDFAGGLNIPFESGEGNVRKYAKKERLSIEEAARDLRYKFLFKVAENNGAAAVAVAHHADDQVETVLMHLLRGSGLSGLKGMQTCLYLNKFSQNIPIIRPFLSTWRSDIELYLRENDLEPIQDPSNTDTTIFRNKLRHELIPELEAYNPKIRGAILRMSNTLAADHEVLDEVIQEVWCSCVVDMDAKYVSMSIPNIMAQPVGLQRAMIRRAISKLRPDLRDIDFAAVERSLAFASNPSRTNHSDLIANLYLLREGDMLWLADQYAELPTDKWPQLSIERIKVDIPGDMNLGGEWTFSVLLTQDVKSTLEQAYANKNSFQAWVDSEYIESSLNLRVRRSGDRFDPLGMDSQHVKLSDFFINQKIPRRLRDAWPLIYSGNDIVWIPGCRISHTYRLSFATKQILCMRMEKRSSGDRSN